MNKKFMALAVAGVLVCSLSQAQIKKGSLLFGGSAGYGAYKEETAYSQPYSYQAKTKFRNYSVSPSIGKAVKDNLILGLDITFEEQKEKLLSVNSGGIGIPVMGRTEFRSYAKGGGIFARQYWGIATNLYVFAQARLGFAVTRQEFDPASGNRSSYLKGWNANASLYPGLSYAISRKVHFESTFFNLLTLQYKKQKNETDPESGSSNPYTRKGFSVSSSFDNATAFTLGVRVLLSK